MAVLSLRFCARAFSSCGKWGPLFIAVRGSLTIVASLVAEHRLQTRRLSICGSWAQLLRGMWDLPRPGLEPVSPALAGRFSTTAPPGKPHFFFRFAILDCKIQVKKIQLSQQYTVSIYAGLKYHLSLLKIQKPLKIFRNCCANLITCYSDCNNPIIFMTQFVFFYHLCFYCL